MSIHEFVTICTFYVSLLSDGVCSAALARALLDKVQDSVTEFNELQLILFKTSLEQAFVRERSLYSSDDMARAHMFHGDAALIAALEDTYKAIQIELQQLKEQKELLLVEEHVREKIRAELDQKQHGMQAGKQS